MLLNESYWTNRYLSDQSGWDTGSITTPLKQYLDQVENKSTKILIPGCGNAHEAAYLHENGINSVYLLDISPLPLQQFAERYPQFPKEHLILGDFFEHEAEYDLILEQTFFCAIDPSLRENYVKKSNGLLKSNGKLVGVLFDREFTHQGPPFGGSVEEYQALFQKAFEIKTLAPCYNSIPPRQGSEVFIQFIKAQ